MTTSSPIEPRLWTTREAAQILNLGERHVRYLIKNGALQSVKIGRSRRISDEQINEYIRRLTQRGRRLTGSPTPPKAA